MRAAPWLLAISVGLFLAARIASVGAGPVLWPPTDAVDYASMATWMARGEGPVQRVGPAFLPSRVPPTLSVLLLPQALWNGADARKYHRTVFALSLLAIAAFWRLCMTLGLSHPAALAATAVLVLAPGFACYADVVMSDVPGLLFLILALLAARRALDLGAVARWSLVGLGLSSGVLVAFRLTNLVWIAALAAFWRRAPAGGSPRALWLATALAAFLAPLAALAAWQWHAFGSPFTSGYAFWHDRPRLDPLRAWSGPITATVEYYAAELAGLRSDVEGAALGWKSDLHTLPVALLGFVGFASALGRRPSGSPDAVVLRAALAASVALFAMALCFANPHFRTWRYLLPWSLLSAFGVGFALDRAAGALAARRNRSGWLHACAIAAIGLAFLLPWPRAGPGKLLAAWTQAVEEESARSTSETSAGAIRETRLPLALAPLLAPPDVVFVPSADAGALPDVHLAILRQFELRPLRVDSGFESTWDALVHPGPAAPRTSPGRAPRRGVP